MKLLALISCLLVTHGLGSPIKSPRDVNKRRESTPEILDLEHQLKKAAGENKHYFSNAEARPMPQVDGLANENDPQDSIVNPGDTPSDGDDLNDPLDNAELGSMEEYMPMWKTLKAHPEYMESMFTDYMNNYPREESEDPDNSWPSYPDSNDEKERYPYRLEHELMGLGPVIPQGDEYPSFDDKELPPGSIDEQEASDEQPAHEFDELEAASNEDKDESETDTIDKEDELNDDDQEAAAVEDQEDEMESSQNE